MENTIRTFALSTTLALTFMCSANAASPMGNVNQTDIKQKTAVSQLDFTEMYENQDDDYDYEDDC